MGHSITLVATAPVSRSVFPLRPFVGRSETPAGLSPKVGWAAIVSVAAFCAAGFAVTVDRWPFTAPAAALAIVVTLALVRERFRTVLVPAVVAGAAVAVIGWGVSSDVVWFAVCVLAGWCALVAGTRPAVAFWLLAAVVIGIQAVTHPDPGWVAWIAGLTASAIGCWAERRQLDLVRQLREAQAGLEARAAAEERNRIARELHDVIAHTLTVALLHLTSARMAVKENPTSAVATLEEAERLSRESLAEVRRTVGMLRTDGPSAATAPPLPSGTDVAALVDRFRDAGVTIALHGEGDTAALPATTGLAVYRIVQEALTNAAKHAPGAPVDVTVSIEPTEATVTVTSTGAPGHGSGLGLAGMAERAQLLGGTCEAGPGEAGPGEPGWVVRARLPLTATPAS